MGSIGDLALFSVYKTLPLPHGGFLLTKNACPAAPLRPAPRRSTFAQTLDLLHRGFRASGWMEVERGLTTASRWVTGLIHWDRSRTMTSGGARWDPRLLGYGASSWSLSLMRLIDPEEVVVRRRRNFTRLAAHLRGHLSLPFSELPRGTCPLFLPVMVPDKPRFLQELHKLGVESVNLWDVAHPTCPLDLAAEVAGWRGQCVELPIHQELSPEDDRPGRGRRAHSPQ